MTEQNDSISLQAVQKILVADREAVDAVTERVFEWRLLDMDEESLNRLQRTHLVEMQATKMSLLEAESRFDRFLQNGLSFQASEVTEEIKQLANEWNEQNEYWREMGDALVEVQLRNRLIRLVGGVRRLYVWDMLILAGIFIVIIMAFADIFLDLPQDVRNSIHTIDTVFSIFFLGDFFLRLYLSPNRRYYARTHWIDFFSSIPLIEAARFGRLFRIIRIVRVMRLRRVLHWLRTTFRGFDQLSDTLQNNLLQRSIIITVALLVFGAFMITWLEGSRSGEVSGFEQSLWWSFSTVVTGGFADLYNPQTALGRVVTVGLVLLGLTVTGIFTASLTSVLVEDDATRMEQNQHNIEQQLALVDQKLNLLSSKTNEGLIALETVAQTISNPTNNQAVAEAVCQNLMDYFDVQQASVHVLERGENVLQRLAGLGAAEMMPAFSIAVGKGKMGKLTETLDVPHVADQDLEPFTSAYLPANGMRMICPMVAMGQFVGFIHVVLPEDAGRFFLYNRVPMTLAHQLAMSLQMTTDLT